MMMLSLRYTFLVICFLGIICVLLLAYLFPQQNRVNVDKLANDTITQLEGSKVFVIAPYYDDRKVKTVRILGIVHHKDVKKLYCYLFCSISNYWHVVEAKIDIHSDRFGFPYGLADIICDEPPNCRPVYVCLHNTSAEIVTRLKKFEIRNRERRELLFNFTVCISTMYGNYSNALQFIQTIEMYKLLGAQKVVIYLKDCNQMVKNILDYYSKEGILEVIPWPIQKYMKPSSRWHIQKDNTSDIGYYGQMSTLNDCIYRNMYISKFVALNDVDEIILPFHHLTWNDMMENLQRENPGASVFLFESHVFPQTVVTDGAFLRVSSWKHVPGFNLLQHVHREPNGQNIFKNPKMILDPRSVVQSSVHSILKGDGRSVFVPSETALVHHCRLPWHSHLNKSDLIDDKTIWRYNHSLIQNVNRVIRKLF